MIHKNKKEFYLYSKHHDFSNDDTKTKNEFNMPMFSDSSSLIKKRQT